MERQHFESLYPDNARFSDIQKLSEFIKSGSSAQVLSLPGVGRGTVMGLLAHNKKVRIKHFGKGHNSIHFVLVNFSEIRNRSLHDATKFLFLALADSLRERGMSTEYTEVNTIFKEALGFNDELVMSQALKEAVEFLTLEKKLKLVLLFDRFEEYVPTVTSEFFANLRTLRSRAKYQFLVIFSLNRPLEDLLEPARLSDFHEFVAGHSVYLPLYEAVTTDFRVGYIEKVTGKKLPGEIFSGIIKETGGVGKLVKLSVETILAHDLINRHPEFISGSQNVKKKMLKQVQHDNKEVLSKQKLGGFLFSKKPIQEALAEICRSLTPSEQTALIKQKFDDKSPVEYLECIGVLTNNKIQIPLFDQHIRSHAEERSLLSKRIIYDEGTNTIRMGDAFLSDQLTSSEFKLLSFLIQSGDRILTRDEIIGIVWSDVKSTAGITDQAVDQLIFRLRRKIEEDPNKPSHLLTVKGRGFKFVA